MTAAPEYKTKDAALAAALRQLSTRWPNKFAAKKLDELMPSWKRATMSNAIAALVPAAIELTATWQGPAPNPPDLAKAAREYENKFLRTTRMDSSAGAKVYRDPLYGAKVGWVQRLNADGEAYVKPFYQLRDGGGFVGLSSVDVDAMLAGTLTWGWE